MAVEQSNGATYIDGVRVEYNAHAVPSIMRRYGVAGNVERTGGTTTAFVVNDGGARVAVVTWDGRWYVGAYTWEAWRDGGDAYAEASFDYAVDAAAWVEGWAYAEHAGRYGDDAPLSGEWSGGPTVSSIVNGHALDVEINDDIVTAWEDGYRSHAAILCEVCEARPAVDEARDVNGSGPWVRVCSAECADALVGDEPATLDANGRAILPGDVVEVRLGRVPVRRVVVESASGGRMMTRDDGAYMVDPQRALMSGRAFVIVSR